MRRYLQACGSFVATWGVVALSLAECAEPLPEQIGFNAHIRPILAAHCVACHGGVQQASGLSFVDHERALAEADSGLQAIVPGDPESSYLLERVASDDEDFRMPPADHGPPLSPREIALLREWIDAGAPWEPPWSFVLPQHAPLPEVSDPAWPRQSLDRFILARLDAEGLKPAPEADRAEWLRRVSFALVGLPPTTEEYARFRDDRDEGAYERVVDRLLASPHFGERWASVWLDLARYADTMGYEKDPHRDIWPWRDWLIRALNAGVPYDEFTVKLLSGDLLPDATLDDRLATAFHRNTQTNTEGGTDDEEFRTAAVIDRVNTTWQVWQATTFGCAQCHSHPYDPIEHEEYFRFLACFNTTRDCDLDEELPLAGIPLDDAEWTRAAELDERIGQLRRDLHRAAMGFAGDKSQWRNLPVDKAQSTGSTQLRIATSADENLTEVLAEGTITAGSQFMLEAPLPTGVESLTALRIEALPKDLESALRTAPLGFVVSRLKAFLIQPDEEPRELAFRVALCDEPEPTFDAEESLRDSSAGWGDYTRQNFPRFAVFVFDRPVELPAGARIRLALNQDRIATGNFALVIQRGRYFISASDDWPAWVDSTAFAAARAALADALAERQKIAATHVPVMQEQAPHVARKSFVFERGNWLDKGKPVLPGVPAVFDALPDDAPPNRLAIARWIASRDNPLTARVEVNRIWEQLYGRGIVETAEDFGTSGTAPTHPELIDHLAVRFMDEHEWSLKQLLREMVLSATFRQSARVSPELVERDPHNRLLARGPRQRLRSEMIRDQALVLSGRLSREMYGPPVMPPQPEGIWQSAYSLARWETAEDANRFRRAIYTYWKRTSPYPSLTAFDAPSRDICTSRRIVTNTPLQALVTLNDPAFVELAAGFAERMAAAAEKPGEQIAWGYEAALGRAPPPAVAEELMRLYDDAAASFDADPQQAQHLAASRAAFALSVVAGAMLNLDEVLTQ